MFEKVLYWLEAKLLCDEDVMDPEDIANLQECIEWVRNQIG